MGRRSRLSLSQRDRQRASPLHKTEFAPSFSVLRPVVFEEDGQVAATQFMMKIFRAALEEKRMKRSDLEAIRIIPPNEWCVRMVQQDRLIEQQTQRRFQLTGNAVFRAYSEVNGPMSRMLQSAPQRIKLPLGEPMLMNGGNGKQVVGFEPLSWRKIYGQHLQFDKDGRQLPLDVDGPINPDTQGVEILAAEAGICNAAIAKLFAAHTGELGPAYNDSLQHTPRLKIFRAARGDIDPERFRRMAPVMAEAMPTIYLGEVDASIRLDPTFHDPLKPIIRPMGLTQLRAA